MYNGNETKKYVALRVAWLISTWKVLGYASHSTLFFTFYFFIFIILLIYIIYFITFYSLLFFLFYLEWIQNVFWPRLTYKCVEPVVSISWASCSFDCSCQFQLGTGLLNQSNLSLSCAVTVMNYWWCQEGIIFFSCYMQLKGSFVLRCYLG